MEKLSRYCSLRLFNHIGITEEDEIAAVEHTEAGLTWSYDPYMDRVLITDDGEPEGSYGNEEDLHFHMSEAGEFNSFDQIGLIIDNLKAHPPRYAVFIAQQCQSFMDNELSIPASVNLLRELHSLGFDLDGLTMHGSATSADYDRHMDSSPYSVLCCRKQDEVVERLGGIPQTLRRTSAYELDREVERQRERELEEEQKRNGTYVDIPW